MSLAWPTMSEGQWNLIASGVTTGNVNRLKSKYAYFVTSVVADAAEPDDSIKDKSPELFEQSNQEPISSPVSIDVYLWPENSDTDNNDTNIADAIQVDAW